MMVVTIETEPTFLWGVPRPLFTGAYITPTYPTFTISPDGQRFLMIKGPAQTEEVAPGLTQLNVVDNWFEELRRLAPPAE